MAYCSNCGTELREGVKFCTGCGKPVGTRPQAAPTPSYKEKKSSAKKGKVKKTESILRRIIRAIVIFTFLVLISVFIRSLVSGMPGSNGSDTNTSGSSNDSSLVYSEEDGSGEGDIREANPAYTAVFSDKGIYDESALAGYGLSSAEFVRESEGTIDKLEYGYKGDTVEVMVETLYYPVSDYSDDQKAQILDALKSRLAAAEALSFVTVNYDMGSSFCKAEIITEDLDNEYNIQSAVSAGILKTEENSAVSLISFEQSKAAMSSSGFIAKWE